MSSARLKVDSHDAKQFVIEEFLKIKDKLQEFFVKIEI
jgi:hypothetical protein